MLTGGALANALAFTSSSYLFLFVFETIQERKKERKKERDMI